MWVWRSDGYDFTVLSVSHRQNKQMCFQNKHFTQTFVSSHHAHTKEKKNHLKHAPSFISRAVDSLRGSVSLKKAHTPILIAEQNVERG